MNKQIIMDLRARLNRAAAEAIIDLFERVEELEKAQKPSEEEIKVEPKVELKIEEPKEELKEEAEEEIE